MRIIINCDDLGANATVNDRIFELMEQGRVTSATLMMNGPAIEDAVKRLANYPQCSFGVHLNVTEFAPLSAHPHLLPLLNGKGEFAGNARRDPINIPLTAAIRQGVYAEWCAQIERAFDLGVPVSHLDSHHHVHTRASLFGVLKAAQKKFGIRRIRLRPNVLGAVRSLRKRARVLTQLPWNFSLRHVAPAAETTDGFASFTIFHQRLQAGCGWAGSIELMCHPGRERYAAETELLRGPWKEQLAGVARLISYNNL